MPNQIALRFSLIAILASLVTVFITLVIVPSREVEDMAEDGQLRVVATVYPAAFAAEGAGGDLVSVTTIVPPGTEPHDFEPTPRDIAVLERADVVVTMGGIDEWVHDLEEGLEKKNIDVIRLADTVELLLPEESGNTHEKADHDHHDAGFDPHFWLDPERMITMSGVVGRAFMEKDPDQRAAYEALLAAHQARLARLDQAYQEGLMGCQSRDMVVAHDAFHYLADRYGLNQIAIAGLSPDEEPSPRRLADIVDLVRERGITTIFFETLVSPRLAETIAGETGATVDMLNPIEGLTAEERAAGESYVTLMEDNLAALRRALVCP